MDLLGLLPLWYSLGAPGLALVACLVCRRHRVLLWLGSGLLVLTIGATVLVMVCSNPQHPTAETGQLYALFFVGVTVLALPALAAGAILLVGGLVRWGLTWLRASG